MRIIAYRGVDKNAPENTMPAFREAILEGASAIQLDVHFSRDKELVVFHDDSESRMIEGVGFVRHHTLEELQSYSFKHYRDRIDLHIPSLKEYLEWAKNLPHTTIIHMKNNHFLYPGMEEAVLDLVEKLDLLDRVILASTRVSSMQILRDLHQDVRLAMIVDNLEENFFEEIAPLKLEAILPNRILVTEGLINQARGIGLEVWPFSVNRLSSLRRLETFDIQGILTRDVEGMREALNEKNPYDKETLKRASLLPDHQDHEETGKEKTRFPLGRKKKEKAKGGFVGILISMAVSVGLSALAAFLVMKLLESIL